MTLTHEESPVMGKTRELCQVLADHPNFVTLRQSIETFMADENARAAYEEIHMMSQSLREKQETGVNLSPEEIAQFEKKRDTFLDNPVAKSFLEAQSEMESVRTTVTKYVMKTFELGRAPEAEDLHSCGSGCSCH
jgi:cell fate (sporulation/competence/biofilm development) regulator YlbF (YheA/YmcA/DUF963 family)